MRCTVTVFNRNCRQEVKFLFNLPSTCDLDVLEGARAWDTLLQMFSHAFIMQKLWKGKRTGKTSLVILLFNVYHDKRIGR